MRDIYCPRVFFFFKQKTAYEIMPSLVGSEMCIRDSFKTLHILSVIDSEPYRRGIKGMRNLQEGRHALAEKVFHGRRRELFQRYREGMEDQLGALGIVLNCLVLWTTVYSDAALTQLRAQGY